MIRNKKFFPVSRISEFFLKANYWADQFAHFCSFKPHHGNYPLGTFPSMIGAGANHTIESSNSDNFDSLKSYISNNNDWLLGHFGYDLKNEIEELTSKNAVRVDFPEMTFFQPQHLIHFNEEGVLIETPTAPETVFYDIEKTEVSNFSISSSALRPDCTKEEYINTVKLLRKHIEEGDVYEVNYCMNYHADAATVDPISLFEKLTKLSPNPFAVLYKLNGRYALSASPERFVKKENQKISSQPIKGTAARGPSKEMDSAAKNYLRQSEKEQAENMMIVDLVRNDLAKSCVTGSVRVDEMFGIYTFPQLHQMISTVSGQLKENLSPVEAIRNAFPMGSMTGAPKIKVMELIEKYEHSRRGLFSGAIGYFDPNNDFDFNVVIRSLFYDASLNRLSFSVGSAITYDSDPEKEYEECLLKASAIMALIPAKN